MNTGQQSQQQPPREPSSRREQNTRVVVASAVLMGVALICGAMALMPMTPANANNRSQAVTVMATDEGDIGGVIIGGGTSQSPGPTCTGIVMTTTLMPPSATVPPTQVATLTSVPPTKTPTNTPAPTKTPTKTPAPTKTPTPGPSPTPKPTKTPTRTPSPTPRPNCTLTQGYWGNHASAWPVSSLTIGGVTYSKTQLLNILKASTRGDATYILMQQLIAAMLNVANGADPSAAQATINAASAWMAQNPVGSKPKDPTRQVGIDYSVILDNYNNGIIGPGHCGGAPTATPTKTPIPSATPEPTNTSTPVPTETPTAVPTPTGPDPNAFEYTCRTGPAVDSVTGLDCGQYHGSSYSFESGTWWLVRTYCMTDEQCEVETEETEDIHASLPCVPILTSSGIILSCRDSGRMTTMQVRAEVNTSCPLNEVLRAPYPRTLVNVPTNFTLVPHEFNSVNGISSSPQSPDNLFEFIDANGNPTEEGYQLGVWRDLRLIMRSRRFNGGEDWIGMVVPQPQWVFSDRDWNNGPEPRVQDGHQATYVYQTASSGLLTTMGRAFDSARQLPADLYNLAAYNVALTTYCGHEWRSTVTLATRVWQSSGPCYETRVMPDGKTYEPVGTSNENCDPGWVSPGYWTYGWGNFATDWAPIDMRSVGRSTTYDYRTRTLSGGNFKGQEYWDDPSGIWVPVIEIQSVMRDECVAEGSCEPPRANSD